MKIINPFAKKPKGGGWLVFKHKNFVDDFGFKWIDRLEVRGTPSKSSDLNVFENGDIMLASTVLPYDGWLLFVAPLGSARSADAILERKQGWRLIDEVWDQFHRRWDDAMQATNGTLRLTDQEEQQVYDESLREFMEKVRGGQVFV